MYISIASAVALTIAVSLSSLFKTIEPPRQLIAMGDCRALLTQLDDVKKDGSAKDIETAQLYYKLNCQ